MIPAINAFVLGATAMACLVAALFFVTFWRRSRDRFFLFFAIAFFAFAVNQLGFSLRPKIEHETFYVVRLVGFLFILAAIVEKNRRRR